MDLSPADNTNKSLPQSDGETDLVSEKRQMENVESKELAAKRAKIDVGEIRKVAEIVLVLSAMAGMRGGAKNPTEAEVKLMEEARAKLVEICQDLAPKDLVARDSIGTVIEDLGLNSKLKDQRLGFRGSRLSIKEKLSLSKRKMEESKKFAAPSATYTTQITQPSFSAMPESHGPSHAFRMLPSDKPTNTPISSGVFSASLPGHVSAATPASATLQPFTTDVKVSTVSSGLPGSQLGRDSTSAVFSKVEKTQSKVEGGSNGASYAMQVPANASANHSLVNAPSWSMQPHSASSGKSAPENKMPNHNFAKVEVAADLGRTGATQAARDQTSRPFMPQTPSANLPSIHPPMQGMKYVQPPSFFNNHNEIAKIVQKLLQPKLPEYPTWIPPSREYMSTAMTCQICKLTVNEVETVVLCDACENGFHIKCREAINQKGIPRGEWHCRNCMALSNGKPLPPKYGRVMRSATPPKGPSNPAGSQSSSEKKTEMADLKVNQQKTTNGVQNHAGSGSVNNVESASDSRLSGEREMPRNVITSSGKDADQSTCSFPNNSTEISTQQDQVSESLAQEKNSLSESSEKISNKCEESKPLHISQDIIQTEQSNFSEAPLTPHQDHSIMEESASVRGNTDCSSRFEVKKSEQDYVHSVEWIGNEIKVADGKTFYKSCCINGVSYKVQDHALFHSSNGKLTPSKLQDMWEEIETGSKWVLVSQCYFPGDLPAAVGHPCAPESNEVYESNHVSSVMASLIEGPCEVFPPNNFKEMSERQNQLATEANSGSVPVYICKYVFYNYLCQYAHILRLLVGGNTGASFDQAIYIKWICRSTSEFSIRLSGLCCCFPAETAGNSK
ncbi:RING/FYVE/PHD ZINC FINGER SUPERFAMILY PROTEIN [Salix koriyanagi]|uniref:RING/FYVE/PHD ZINC FINGER SUPERFAMILY PROTEIN n=1 Tax=Salix koriyanagi TaxID=2511006 RepID=A0A9Q1AM35_9ROSI|nr:RING/FYVE/PHD ZINC FINGER SUPERFAMILY PROTEIN [Salix koriyanagi]